MARTFLELVQAAADEISAPQPSQLFGSADDQSRAWVALGIREGKQFFEMPSNKGGWQNLHKEYNFQTEATSDTGTTTSGSKIITGLADTSSLSAGDFMASGAGIPYQAIVNSVDSATQVTLDRPCTASGTVPIVFGKFRYALPSDFEYFVNRTFWDGSYVWELLGPIPAQEKQILRYGVGINSIRRKFYVKNNKLCLDPAPSESGQTIAYDYYSNQWCTSALGVGQAQFAADDDLYSLDEDCFVLGLKWRYLRSKGLSYQQEFKDYQDTCERVMARDGGARTLNLNDRGYQVNFLGGDNIPDTGFGE